MVGEEKDFPFYRKGDFCWKLSEACRRSEVSVGKHWEFLLPREHGFVIWGYFEENDKQQEQKNILGI